MKKVLITIITTLLPMMVFADAVEIDGLYYKLITKGQIAEVSSCSNNSGTIIIPEIIEYEGVQYTVSKICSWAFSSCQDVHNVTIPKTIKTIGEGAFLPYDLHQVSPFSIYISDLKSWCEMEYIQEYEETFYTPFWPYHLFLNGVEVVDLEIPNTVDNINPYAFYNCKGIKTLTMTGTVKGIGERAFDECTDLIAINLSQSISSIGNRAFGGCKNVTSITIPNSVTSIGNNAFQSCSGLTTVTIGNSVTSIGDYAFSGCKDLTSITIPNSLTSLGNNVFEYCTGLTSITIGNRVANIGMSAFSGCTGLTDVNIYDIAAWSNISFSNRDSNPLNTAHHIFLNGVEIKDLVIPNSVTNIGNNVFSGCSGLTSVAISNSVTSIGNSAFSDCTGLTSVSVGNSVMNIGEMAFLGCSNLNSVYLGEIVSSIGYSAFGNCSNLTDVYCFAEIVPNTNTDAFKDSYIEYATLHVPTASFNDYINAEPWKNFKKKKFLEISDIPEMQKCATPTIAFENGKIYFSCETDGVELISEITSAEINKKYDSEIVISNTYKVTVYATKVGFIDSDKATIEIQANSGVLGDLTGDGKVDVSDHVKLSSIIMDQNK